MDSQEFYPLLRRNIIPIGLGVLGLLLISIGAYQFFSHRESEPAMVFEQNSAKELKQVNTDIVVDVEGAVMKPGVYKISSQARMVDALAKAGGLSEEADRQYVEKNINLAGKLSDGLKVYVPRVGEQIMTSDSSSGSTSSAGGPVININSASISDLNSLPGIGDVTAQKIIDGRPYASADELLNRKIVGSATYEKIKDKIAAN